VEVPRSAVVDLSQPNAFNEQGALQDLLNVDEAEFLVAANHQGRLVSVQRLAGTEEASFALRYGSEIRWGGRILLVAGLAVSAYRIADAPPAQRAEVTGEEIGGQVLGYAGTVAAVAACVGLGIATGGVGLLLCGLAGGIGGGLLGSALGGAAVRSLQYQTSGPSRPATELEAQQSAEAIARANIEPVCPSCHQLRLQWDERLRFRALGGSPRSGAKLTPEELARLRDWLEAGSPKQ
jgi:hypothetical protein